MNFLTTSVKILADTFALQAGLARAKSMVSSAVLKMRTALKAGFTRMTRYAKLAGLAIVAAMAMSTKAFANFDDAMTKSLAIMTDLTIELRKELEETALSIARNSVKSATELAKSYFYLASAGLDALQSIKALPAVEAFAVAGAFDMARATDLLTDAQSALGLTVKDSTKNMKNMVRISDVLIGANTLANASAEQFSEALMRAGPAMKAYNIEVEEGTAVLAAYADQGKKGAEGGELFGRMLRLMIQGFIKNRSAWDEFKISIVDVDDKMRPLADIVRDLTNAMDGMGVTEKARTLDMLGFKARTQQAIMPLLGMADAIEDYDDKLKQMGGTTQQVRDKQMKSFSAQMKVLWNNIVDVGIAMGEGLAPTLETLGFLFREYQDDIKAWATGFTSIEDGTKGLLSGLEKVVKVVAYMKDGFVGMKVVFYGAATLIIGLIAIIGKGFIGLQQIAEDAHNKIAKTWLGKKLGFEQMDTGLDGMRATVQALGEEVENLWEKMGGMIDAKTNVEKVEEFFDELERVVAKRANKITIPDMYENLPFGGGGTAGFAPKRPTVSSMGAYTGADDTEKATIDVTEAYRDMYNEMGRMSQGNYDAQLQTLDDLKERYYQAGMDRLTIDQWYLEQKQQIDIELLKSSDSVVDGFKAAGMELKRDMKTWGEVAADVAKRIHEEFAGAMAATIVRGQDFKETMKAMLLDVIEYMLKVQLMNAMTAGIGGIFGGLFGGGAPVGAGGQAFTPTNPYGLAQKPPGAAEGGYVAQSGLAVIHKGETVTPADKVGGGNIDIRVHNEGRENLVVSKTESYMMSDKRILDVWMKAKESGSAAFRRKTR